MACIAASAFLTFSTVCSASSVAMPIALPKMPVAIPPGEIEFTRTPSSPSSIAAHRVRWMTAALSTA